MVRQECMPGIINRLRMLYFERREITRAIDSLEAYASGNPNRVRVNTQRAVCRLVRARAASSTKPAKARPTRLTANAVTCRSEWLQKLSS
jgi:hypothetical protein